MSAAMRRVRRMYRASPLGRLIGRSITIKVFGGVAVALALGAGATIAVDGRLTRQSLNDQALRDLDAKIETLRALYTDRITRLGDEMRAVGQEIGSDRLLAPGASSMLIRLLAQSFRGLSLDLLHVVDAEGNSRAHIGTSLEARSRATLESEVGSTALSVLEAEGGALAQVAVVAMRPPGSEERTYLVGGFLLDDSWAFGLRAMLGADVILAGDGRVVAGTLAEPGTIPVISASGRPTPQRVTIEGRERLVAFADFERSSGKATLSIGVVLPDPLAALDRSLRASRVAGLGLLFLVAGAVSFVLVRVLTRPLRTLTERAMTIAGTREAGRAEGDEVESIAHSLERLRQIDETKGMFIASAAHELRNPLTAISGLAGTLARHRRHMTWEQIDEHIDALNRQGQRLSRLAEELLDLSQIERGTISVASELVPMSRAFRAALAAAPAPAGVAVHLDAARDVVALGDPVRVEEILTNLLTNAYAYGGRTVHVEASNLEDDVLVVVADDGPGAPTDMVLRLFEPFARGENASGAPGAGLGLAIVRGLVEALGGRIWYEAGSPGARFVFILPGASADRGSGAASADDHEEPGDRARILPFAKPAD